MSTHELKTWPEFFGPLRRGEKSFEVRVNDRGFKVGDILILKEWNRESETYTGESEERIITYILHGGTFGLPSYLCVISLQHIIEDFE